MRRVGFTTVRVQRNRYFGNAHPIQARLDDHLGRELHARAALVEAVVKFLCETPQSAVDIMNWGVKPLLHHQREYGIAQPAMRKWHGTWHHPATTRDRKSVD